MTSRDPLLRWSSPARPDKHAAEVVTAWLDGRGLERSMRRAAHQIGDARFLVINVEFAGLAEVQRGIKAFHAAGGRARLSLSGSRKTLAGVDAAAFDDDHVGLMLDAVDANTPCADIAWNRIEALRFSPDFVSEAARNVRLGCVLESMLGLARDIGLCTLGANDLPGGASLSGRADFDYVPVEQSLLEGANRTQEPSQRIALQAAFTLAR